MAHVKKLPSGRWQARYIAPDGNERAKNFDRKINAERFVSVMEADKLRGEGVDPRSGQVRFADYPQGWLAGKVDLLPGTIDKVTRHLRKHIMPAFGKREIATIQPADVRAWVAKLSASGLAPDTVKAVYLTFGQVMKTAEIDRLIVRTPCIGIKLPKATAREGMHYLTAEQVSALADAITPRFRALVYTAPTPASEPAKSAPSVWTVSTC